MNAETLLRNTADVCGWGQEAINGAVYSFIDSLSLLSLPKGLFEAYIVTLVYRELKGDDPELTKEEVRIELGLENERG